MAVNTTSTPEINLCFLIPANSLRSVFLKKGVYAITSTPNQSITVESSLGFFSIVSGVGSFIINSDQNVLIANPSSSIPMQVFLSLIRAEVVTPNTLTLDTISTTSTYTQTGTALKVLVIGGGQGGGGYSTPAGGRGGAGGRHAYAQNVTLPGNVSTVVGGGGAGAGPGDNSVPGNFGGDSSFGSITTAPSNPAAVAAVAGGSAPGGTGSPSESVIIPTGMAVIIGGPYTGGASRVGGGILAGGGAGINNERSGGGGRVPVGHCGIWQNGGGGGAGRIFILRA